jgi:predicted transcriptional regulator of viral defense system
MREQGRVIGIQRDSFTVLKDPLVIASRIVWPSYVSLWYALSYHGMTLQVPQGITVLTSRQTFRKQLEFQGTRITFVLIPPSFLYGYDRIEVDGHEVFMAYPEKAILDALHLERISVSEISEIIKEHRRELNLERMVEYALRSNDDLAIRRLGYLLERSGYRKYKRLQGVKGTAIPLEPSLPSDGPLNRKWGVIDNLGVAR